LPADRDLSERDVIRVSGNTTSAGKGLSTGALNAFESKGAAVVERRGRNEPLFDTRLAWRWKLAHDNRLSELVQEDFKACVAGGIAAVHVLSPIYAFMRRDEQTPIDKKAGEKKGTKMIRKFLALVSSVVAPLLLRARDGSVFPGLTFSLPTSTRRTGTSALVKSRTVAAAGSIAPGSGRGAGEFSRSGAPGAVSSRVVMDRGVRDLASRRGAPGID